MAENSGIELAKAYVQIIPSARGIKGKIAEALGGEAHSAGKSAGESIAKAIKGAIAAAGIGKIVKDALTQGTDLQQSIGGVETLFKSSADTVRKYASEAYKTAGLSANDYMEQVTSFSASLLQSLGGDTSQAAESANAAIIAMADNANKMGTDIASIQNAYQGFAKQNYTMLDNLKLGYGGTKQEMERLLADAEALSGVHYDIENLNDVYSAIQVIQDKLDITGTTAKEAAETFSGSLASMKAAAQNLLGNLALGEDIAPSLRELMETVNTFVSKNLIPMLGNILRSALDVDILLQIPQIAENAVKGLQDIIQKIVAALPMAIQNFASALIDMADVLLDGVAELIVQVVTAMVDNIGLFVDVAVRIVTALADGLIENVAKLTESAPEILDKLVASFAENAPKIVRVGIQLLVTLANALAENIEAIIPMLTESITEIIAIISELLSDTEILKSLVNAAAHLIAAIVVGLIEALPDLLVAAVDLVNALAKALIDAIPVLVEAAIKLVACIGEALVDLVMSAGDWGRDLIDSFIGGIKERFHALIDAVKEIAQTVRDFLGFSEPKKGPLSDFHTFAPDMIDLWTQGVRQNIGAVSSSAKLLAGVVSDNFSDALSYDNTLLPALSVSDRSAARVRPMSESRTVSQSDGHSISTIARITVPLQIDGQTIARATYEANLAEANRRGQRAVR